MIQQWHDKKNSVLAIIIVAIVAVPFAFFGVTSVFQYSNTTEEIADVNGENYQQT